MLSIDAETAEALERYRKSRFTLTMDKPDAAQARTDYFMLCDTLLRLFPTGWDEKVTPARLRRWGFKNRTATQLEVYKDASYAAFIVVDVHTNGDMYFKCQYGWDSESFRNPRNMLQVWLRLQRCGLPNPFTAKPLTEGQDN